MRKFDFVLTDDAKEASVIDMLNEETHILIHLREFPSVSTPYYELSDGRGTLDHSPVNSTEFIRLSKMHFGSVKFGATACRGEIKGTIHVGSWQEILLLDLSKNIDCVCQEITTEGSFTIGRGINLYMDAEKQTDGDYKVIRRTAATKTVGYTRSDIVPRESPEAALVEKMYLRIKENFENVSFAADNRDEEILKYTHHLLSYY